MTIFRVLIKSYPQGLNKGNVMAKNGKIRLTIGIISVTLVVLGMIITGVLAYGDTSNKADSAITDIAEHKESVRTGFEYIVKHNEKEMAELKEDGCDPGRKAITDLEVIKEKVETIDVRQETMRRENKESFEKILEKL